MRKTSLLLIAALIIMTLGCKKDEDAPKTAKENLVGTWLIKAMSISPAYFGLTDLFAFMDACEKDDLQIFNADGTAKSDQGALKCVSTDPQTSDAGTWSLSTDNKTLTLTDVDGYVSTLTINTLTSSSLVVNSSMVEGDVTYTMTLTMEKK